MSALLTCLYPADSRWSRLPANVGFVLPRLSAAFLALATAATSALLPTSQAQAQVGTVYAWGHNNFGQLGNGSTANSSVPAAVQFPNSAAGPVSALAWGSLHSLALLQDGSVYAWGDNSDGQLGNGTTTDSHVPVAVAFPANVTSPGSAVAAGNLHSLALLQDGSVYAWGSNYAGDLGNGSTANSSVPVAVQFPASATSPASAVAAGSYHSLTLLQDGSVYAWGDNYNGNLGDGTTTSRSTPVAVQFPAAVTSPVRAVAAGYYQSSAVLQNGTVYAWGYNSHGQLGNGTTTDSSVPGVVQFPAGATSPAEAVAGGYAHSLALLQDGSVYAWGSNFAGQLGNGTTTDSSLPVPVDPMALKNIVAVAATYADSYALAVDGSLWVWGANSYGELGLGNTLQQNSPQQLLPPTGYAYTLIGRASPSGHVLALLVQLPPHITSSLNVPATQGQPFAYTITASNTPTSFAATGLPAGVSIDLASGNITGTPTDAIAMYAVTITATNAAGSDQETLTINLASGAPVITSVLAATATQGQGFTYTITAVNSPTSFSAANLPSGLSFAADSHQITGTPRYPGTFAIDLAAGNQYGTDTKNLVLTVAGAVPAITSAPAATGQVGQNFANVITATNSPTSFGAVGLPAGLNVDGTSGVITGLPTQAGNFSVNLYATNETGTSQALALSLTIAAPPAPQITGGSLNPPSRQGVAFAYQISATNSPTNYNATGLPAGLSVDAVTGRITGTPTTAGTYSVQISAINQGGSGKATLNLLVKAQPPVITSASTPAIRQGVAFGYSIVATNAPTLYGVGGAVLPVGLSINQATGRISGTPQVTGRFTYTIAAFNSGGSGSATLILDILPAGPQITSPTSAAATAGQTFNYQITAKYNPTSFGVSGLPAGLSCNLSTGLITGTPTKAGSVIITVAAFNNVTSDSQKVALSVK